MPRIEPPWSDDVVALLNAWQANDQVHPFTCPGEREECAGQRELAATTEGWVCQCGAYRQAWAHDFMAEPKP